MKKLFILVLGTLLSLTACGSGDIVNPNSLISIDPSVEPSEKPTIDPREEVPNPGEEGKQGEDTSKGGDIVNPSEIREKESSQILSALTLIRESAQNTIDNLNSFNLGLHMDGLLNTNAYRYTTYEYSDGNISSERLQWNEEVININNLDASLYLDNAYEANNLSELRAALGIDIDSEVSFRSYEYHFPTYKEASIHLEGSPSLKGRMEAYLDNANVYAKVNLDALVSIEAMLDSLLPGFSAKYSLENSIPLNGQTYLPLNTIGAIFNVSELATYPITEYVEEVKNYEIPHFDEDKDLVSTLALVETLLNASKYKISDFIDYSISSNEEYNLDFSLTFGPEQYNALMNTPVSSMLSNYLTSVEMEILESIDLTLNIKIDKNNLISSLNLDIRSLSVNEIPLYEPQGYYGNDDDGNKTVYVFYRDLLDMDFDNFNINFDLSYRKDTSVFPSHYLDYSQFDISQFLPQ